MLINSNKIYSLQEVVDKKMIPGIYSYGLLYNLVTVFVKNEKNERVRVYCKETTRTGIKPMVPKDSIKPWHKKQTNLSIAGSELKKFFKLNKPN